MSSVIRPVKLRRPYVAYDDDFFDDMLGIFPNASGYAPKAGCCGKYLYEEGDWEDVVEHDDAYYVPNAEHELLDRAKKEIPNLGVPSGLTYIDFGVGGKVSFVQNAMRLIKHLNSIEYVGVDYCEKALREILGLVPTYNGRLTIKTKKMDLFFPTNKVISKNGAAFGVMNGLTLCNAYGLVKNGNGEDNIRELLRYLSQLCGNGWLLVTVDTNQNEESLKQAYDNPLIRRINLSVFSRMEKELPVQDFDSSAFVYDSGFNIERSSWMHMARATKEQDFRLGDIPIHIYKDQKIHLHDSYKLRQETFEKCCRDANLTVVKYWGHDTGMMLYLLMDKNNQGFSLQRTMPRN